MFQLSHIFVQPAKQQAADGLLQCNVHTVVTVFSLTQVLELSQTAAFCVDTYYSPHNRNINYSMMVAYSYGSTISLLLQPPLLSSCWCCSARCC